jgi:hypothetical protein
MRLEETDETPLADVPFFWILYSNSNGSCHALVFNIDFAGVPQI